MSLYVINKYIWNDLQFRKYHLNRDQKVAGSIPVWGSETFFWVWAWVANSLPLIYQAANHLIYNMFIVYILNNMHIYMLVPVYSRLHGLSGYVPISLRAGSPGAERACSQATFLLLQVPTRWDCPPEPLFVLDCALQWSSWKRELFCRLFRFFFSWEN